MHGYRASAALFFTTSLFLVHCGGGDDDSTGKSGAGGTSTGATGATSGTGGSSAGTTGAAGKAAMGGSGTGGASGSAGQAGTGGTAAGQAGNGGMPTAGRGSGGVSGSAGSSAGAAGKGSAGMSGAAGSAGGGAGGNGGTSGSGSGAGGKGAGGSGGGGGMTLTVTGITEGGMFPDQNTCATSANDSPALTWTAGPTGTMSYAMILLDTANSLNHWVMWDIPSSVLALPAALDDMAMSTDVSGAKQKAFQGNGYTGPCPSGADHVYKFTVYALPVATLTGAMTSQQTSALAMAVMNANPLASASVSAHSSETMAGN